jgi:hypothetical protein
MQKTFKVFGAEPLSGAKNFAVCLVGTHQLESYQLAKEFSRGGEFSKP